MRYFIEYRGDGYICLRTNEKKIARLYGGLTEADIEELERFLELAQTKKET
jgi:hypothetical protein